MVKIAILGFGTVGSGVAEVLKMNASSIAKRAGQEIDVKYILDIRDFPGSPFESLVIHDFEIIEKDPEVSLVVETIGGAKLAYEFTRRALLAGKSVVTSNKELVATHGVELLAIAAEKNVSYLFEASVGGGIPILRPLTNCLAGNEIMEIRGILNGTTNYILTRMFRAGLSFEDALAEAQALGYAEANPSADVDGIDAGRKTCILADLAYGYEVCPDQIAPIGIRSISAADVAGAEACGRVIRLIGRVLRREDGRVHLIVAPHLVSNSCPLACVEDVFNAIMVTGNAVDETMFYGRGAGKLPTASAVVGDVVDIVRNLPARRALSWVKAPADYVADNAELIYSFFIRAKADAAAAKAAFGDVTIISEEDGICVFLTPAMETAKAESCAKALDVLSFIRVLN
ncbi:MAG: homoserine dehydrogenase [Clostridia bacterium]|nr:homoserine dehydrogenase [Clostridia bacterium]